MVLKSMVREKLESIINNENRRKVEELISLIDIIYDEQWEGFVISNNITEDNLMDVVKERLESTYTNSNGKNFVVYPIQGNQNDTLSYMLVIPEGLQDGKELVVESLNYEGTNIFENIVQHEQNNIRRMLEIVEDAPIMIPFLPDVKGGRPYYQQLSRECFEESVDDEYSVIFQELI